MVETPRLQLRELSETDAPALFAIYQDPTVMRFMGPPPRSVDEEIENIRLHRARYYEARGYGLWGVRLRETDALIGRCGLLEASINGASEVELSYLLASAHWGRGLATEAANAVLTFAASALGLRRVVAFVHPENTRSRRVAERVGMRHEGIVPYKAFGNVELFAWIPSSSRTSPNS